MSCSDLTAWQDTWIVSPAICPYVPSNSNYTSNIHWSPCPIKPQQYIAVILLPTFSSPVASILRNPKIQVFRSSPWSQGPPLPPPHTSSCCLDSLRSHHTTPVSSTYLHYQWKERQSSTAAFANNIHHSTSNYFMLQSSYHVFQGTLGATKKHQPLIYKIINQICCKNSLIRHQLQITT